MHMLHAILTPLAILNGSPPFKTATRHLSQLDDRTFPYFKRYYAPMTHMNQLTSVCHPAIFIENRHSTD